MKKSFLCISTLVLLCFSSCTEKYTDTTLYQRNGRPKPIVAVLPVIDSRTAEQDLQKRGITWDISKELTEGIRSRMADSQLLYLIRESGSLQDAEQCNHVDCRQIAKKLSHGLNAAEFVVVTELVNQEEKPYDKSRFSIEHPPKGEIAQVMNIDFRVKVLDMRSQEPKMILQEVIHTRHYIAKPEVGFNYARASYGSTAYTRTPMGVAHNKLIREVTGRIENYIRATKG